MSAGRELFKLWGILGMQGVEKTSTQLKAIDKQTRKTQKAFDRLGRKVTATGKVLTKALTAPLLVAAAVAGKFRADFDQAMTASTAIMGDLSDAMRKDLKTAAIEVTKVVDVSATKAAESYFFLASAGLNAAQSIAALPKVAKFAAAGNFEMALATDLLTDAQSALGLSSKDTAESMANMTRVSDVLVKANTLANATVQQFSEALTNKAGAALRVLGKDIEEGAAVLAVFADQGLKGADAGTALNIVLRDFQRASLKNKQAFKDAGVEVFDLNGEMRNMADIVGDLDGLLAGMSDEQRRATLSSLGFQDKSIAATMALLGTTDAIREYEKGLRSASGITDEVANKQMQAFWKKLGLLKNRLVAVALTTETLAGIGSKILLPVLEFVVEQLEDLNGWFNDLPAAMQKTVKGFILIAVAIGPVIFMVGKLIMWSKILVPLFVALRAGTLSWSAAMVKLQASMLAIPLLIAALVAIGWYWFSQWDQIGSQFDALWAKLDLVVTEGVNSVIQAMTDGILKILDLAGRVASVIPGFGDKLKKAKIAILLFKAAMFKEVGKRKSIANDLNDQARATAGLTETVKEATDAVKGALGIKEKDVEVTKKQTSTVLELAAAKKKAADEAEKAEQERLDFEKDIQSQINELTLSKMELLKLEKEEAILIAEEKGASVFEVVALYALKEQAMKDKIREQEAAKEKARKEKEQRIAIGMAFKLNSVLGKFADNALKRIDIKEKKEIEAVENSKMTEEQKEAAIQRIQDGTAKKRSQLMKEQAAREKLFALFQIGINTASAVIEALPNYPLAIAVGALGIAEAVAVASTPVPFEEGGLIRGTPQGVNALVGEKNQDEVVFPVEDGIDLFLNGILEKIGDVELPKLGSQAEPEAAAAGSSLTLQVGTLIADDRGIKELERKLTIVRIAENQRKGFA